MLKFFNCSFFGYVTFELVLGRQRLVDSYQVNSTFFFLDLRDIFIDFQVAYLDVGRGAVGPRGRPVGGRGPEAGTPYRRRRLEVQVGERQRQLFTFFFTKIDTQS